MKKVIMLIALGLLLLTTLKPVFAESFGYNLHVNTDIASILEDPVDDQDVKLTGYLIKKVSSDKYIFKSGDKQIRVEIDNHVFPKQQFDENTLITILGEVEKDFLQSPEIDVDVIEITNP
ncbi:NirD/YgiW/YdeI family stress tolerance protein [Colwellia sp. 1_MG-2023]|uniref:YgiW/YdeI family stress tolerance OB fold protein n=1 Tax=unclassified Colwellia TaxID=196834 RepID=UPI001C0858DB|nr:MULTISPECIES: NirD/YgiW/YdeI family stress tolerance protein [unclassified Colwellia]MBU2926308.1 NirD/YgiW/YdeI family stress tolerance protein [Colwellia sp. C2M11]MDO6651746.1 NirD/YgiW/YdeI family stress tolerance protein [Colwellia sp. 3_MG-2023]MDO6665343.1 NirD/YgiW/YdeI family stress tolerance protein [Colwellia sp. 2_MG-2023]MDO6689716.1 NirD/YgiW/YdeI family stress tolerance protein [Colwellia sp. 1_MG-2023]